ncbi:hypothetical protein [Bacteroides pyogenes]
MEKRHSCNSRERNIPAPIAVNSVLYTMITASIANKINGAGRAGQG